MKERGRPRLDISSPTRVAQLRALHHEAAPPPWPDVALGVLGIAAVLVGVAAAVVAIGAALMRVIGG